MNTPIIAVDPGKDTGLVMVYLDGSWNSRTVSLRRDMRTWIRVNQNAFGTPLIICEDWTTEKGAKTNQRDAWLNIGWLDGEFGDRLILQQRGDRMWTTAGKLKAAGFGSITNDHQKQAARHLVRWAMTSPVAHQYAAVAQIRENVTAYLKKVQG